MSKHLFEFEVTDRKSFAEFVGFLLADYEKNKNKDYWENNTLDRFLEAMQAYTIDFDGYYKNVHPDLNADVPTWRAFADILKGAVVYE